MNINIIKRGKALALAVFTFIAFLVSFALPVKALEFTQGIWLDGSTTTLTVGGTNVQRGLLIPLWTNGFNLSATSLSQANTNAMPALPLVNSKGYNGRLLCLSGTAQCSAANTGWETFRLAVSVDGSTWISNYTSFTVTCAGTSVVPWGTNIDTYAYPFVAIQQIENTNATVAITNTIKAVVGKTGI